MGFGGGDRDVSRAVTVCRSALSGKFSIFILAFSGFCPDFGGRRGLLWSSFAAWSLSELVNAEFGQKQIIFFSAAKALAGLPPYRELMFNSGARTL